MTFECSHCHRTFARDKTLDTHQCEPRRRWEVQNQRGVQIGFQGYLQFRNAHLRNSDKHTYQDFCRSSYYRAFVKWGDYCVAVQVIDPAQYLIWLLNNQKKIDRWCSDQLYTEYLVEYLRLEMVQHALARAVEHSIGWQERTGHPAHDMLRHGNRNALCYDVTTGRVSPWVIYNCESGQRFLTELTSEQVAMIWPYIDSDQWQKKFAERPADQEYAKEILQQAGW